MPPILHDKPRKDKSYSKRLQAESMDNINVITNTAALEQFCNAIAHDTYIAVDTEFLRERTYFAQLCLIQIAGEQDAAIIDPLASDIDLTPLWAILRNSAIRKVFHAGKQDLEIFYHLMDKSLPANVFDTQIAAMALGYTEQIGYAALVENVTGQQIDKTQQYTDWSKRPLKDSQLTYALSDVTELRHVYDHMLAELDRTGRLDWTADLMADLVDSAVYEPAPDEVWQKIKLRSHKAVPWKALKMLAAWREREAMRLNRPRSFFMKDEVLAQIALTCPRSIDELAQIRGIGGTAKSKSADPIIAICREAIATAVPSDVPAKTDSQRLTGPEEDQLDLLRLALKISARQLNVAPRLLADSDDLMDFVRKSGETRLLIGWRYDAFGRQAEDLLNGKAAIGVKGIYAV